MEEGDKGCPMIRMGVSGRTFLLVPAYPGSPGQKAVKRLCVCHKPGQIWRVAAEKAIGVKWGGDSDPSTVRKNTGHFAGHLEKNTGHLRGLQKPVSLHLLGITASRQ